MNKLYHIFIGIILLAGCQNSTRQPNQNIEIRSIPSASIETKVEIRKLISKEYAWLKEPLILLGYKNQNPILRSWETNNLYILKDTLSIYSTFAAKFKAIHIDDNMTIYSSSDSMMVETDIEDVKLKTENRVIDASASSDGRFIYFFTDYKKPIQILDLSNLEIKSTNLIGSNLHIYNSKLYYTTGHPDQSGFVRIFRTEIPELGPSEMIISGAHEEGLTFFPSDSLIGLHANLVSDIRPAIYNIKLHKYAFLENVDSDMNYPVLFPRTEQLGFYNLDNFDLKFFDLEFDFKEAKELGIYE